MRTPRIRWTEADMDELHHNFADTRTEDLARTLGRTTTSVSAKAYQLGLRKSADFLRSQVARRFDGVIGMQTRFQPGHISWNKGQPFNPGGRSVETRYRPGCLSGRAAQLVLPLGAYRINSDGYLDQKISEQPGPQTLRWRSVHRMVWEAAHGPVPENHAVCFKYGRASTDPAKITLDALELVTRRDLMLRNTHHRYGPEVAALVQLRGVLTRQIDRKTKEKA